MSSPFTLTTGTAFDASSLFGAGFAGTPKLTAINGQAVTAVAGNSYAFGIYTLTFTSETAFALTAPGVAGGTLRGVDLQLTLSDGTTTRTAELLGNYRQTSIASGQFDGMLGSNVVSTAVLTKGTPDYDAQTRLGAAVSGVGDINDDGIDDFVVTAPKGLTQVDRKDDGQAGEAFVVFGSRSGLPKIDLDKLDGTNGFAITGAQGGQGLGASVSAAGDVNGDGIADLIVGASTAQITGYDAAAYVVFGARTSFAARLSVNDLNGRNGFKVAAEPRDLDGQMGNAPAPGSSVSAADLNGDGYTDLIIGAPNESAPPKFDANGKIVPTYVYPPETRGPSTVTIDSRYAYSDRYGVIPTGTLDSPALVTPGTFVVGSDGTVTYNAPDNSGGRVEVQTLNNIFYVLDDFYAPRGLQYSAGKTYVVYGSAAGFGATVHLADLNGSTGFTLGGSSIRDQAGTSVSAAGDVNGDGIQDVVVGAPGRGSAYVVFGKAGGSPATVALESLNGQTGFRIDDPAGNGFGSVVSNGGDVNGDGVADLIVGSASGNAYVVFGAKAGFASTLSTAALNGGNGFRLTGFANTEFGTSKSLSAVGDVNGDGIGDLAAISGDHVDVIFGKKSGFAASAALDDLAAASGYRITVAADTNPASVRAAGDVNGDGLGDLIVGSVGATGGIGRAAIVYGARTAHAPVAGDDAFTLMKNTELSNADVTTNDTDADPGTILNGGYKLVTGPAHGTITVTPSGRISYLPTPYYSGTDSFTYAVTDPTGLVGTATVTLTVLPSNDAPFAYNDTVSFLEDASVTFDPRANDYDIQDGRPGGAITIVTGPAHGVVTPDALTGALTYKPRANYSGNDQITYTVKDSEGASSGVATVTFQVTPINDAPVARGDGITVVEDTKTGRFNVRANDTDIEDGTPKGAVTVVTGPAHGTLQVAGTTPDGSFFYTPNANYNGTDSFTYYVTDSLGTRSNTATVSLFVNPVNDVPVAVDDAVTIGEDTPTVIAVRANDTDVEDGRPQGAPTLLVGPVHGTVTQNAAGDFVYAPSANYNGTDSFTYTVKDADGAGSNTGTVRITVDPVNDAPVLPDSTLIVLRDTSIDLRPLLSATDADGDILSLAGVGTASHGRIVDKGDGRLTYTPEAGFVGVDSFTVTVSDGQGGFDTGTVTVDVSRIAPVSPPQRVNTMVNDNQSASSVATGRNGNILVAWQTNDTTRTGDGTGTGIKAIVLSPAGTAVSSEFTVNAGATDSNQFTPSVTALANGNFAALWVDDNWGTDGSGSALTGRILDATGAAVGGSFQVNTEAAGGQYEVAVAGFATGGFAAVWRSLDGSQDGSRDAIKGRVFDASGHGGPEFLVNAETLDNQRQPAITTLSDGSFVVAWQTWDTTQDGNGTAIKARVFTGAGAGGPEFLVNTSAGGNQSAPELAALANGGFVATWATNDGAGAIRGQAFGATGAKVGPEFALGSSGGQPSSTVSSLPDGGFAVAWTDTTATASTLHAQTFTASGTANGPDLTLATGPAGTDFQPASSPGLNGGVVLSWTAPDGFGTGIGTLILAGPRNLPPIAANDSATTNEGTPVTIAVLTNDSDPEGGALTVTAVTQGAHGTVLLNANGTVTYTPGANYNGGDSFRYTIKDVSGLTAEAAVSLTVTSVNDAPSIVAGGTTTGGFTELAGVSGSTVSDTVAGSFAFADPDLTDTHSVRAGAPSFTWSGGTLTTVQTAALAAGTLKLTPVDSTGTGSGSVAWIYSAPDSTFDFLAAGQTLRATYGVTIDDGQGGTATQNVVVTITGTNDAPVIGVAKLTGAVTELVSPGTALTDSGTIAFSDVDLADAHSVTATAIGSPLGTLVATKTSDTTGSGTGGAVTWRYSVDSAKVESLVKGQTKVESFTVAVSDGQGGSVTRTVAVTLTGTNDAPILAQDTVPHTVSERIGTTNASALLSSSANLAFTDVDLTDTHKAAIALNKAVWSGGASLPAGLATALAAAAVTTVGDSTGKGVGTVGIAFTLADRLTDFLAVGETLTATYDVSLTDSVGAVSRQPVTFSITGTNDVPVIDLARSVTAGSVTELAGKTGSTILDTVSGRLAFADSDLSDRPTASVVAQAISSTDASGAVHALTTAQASAIKAGFSLAADPAATHTGQVGWTFSLADNALDFLGANERVTLVSTVQVDDHHGGLVNQAVTVTLTGANDAPTVMADTVGVKALWGYASADAAHGVLANDSDVDGNGLSVSAIGNGTATAAGTTSKATTIWGDYGTLTIKADGSYAYDPNVWGFLAQKLPPGIVPIDSFTYTTSDGRGGTATSQLDVVTVSASQVYVQGTDGNDTLTATPDTSLLGRLFGRDNAMVLNAGNGNDTLIGGKADDVLIAGPGLDKLTGNAGSDTFVFLKTFGKATVTDFKPVTDQIQFDHDTFANFADLKGHAAQVGADVVITADLDHTVTLQNTLLKTLSASDFHFA